MGRSDTLGGRASGGIGRRAGFRFQCPRRVGSSPISRTTGAARTAAGVRVGSTAPDRASALRVVCAFRLARVSATGPNPVGCGAASRSCLSMPIGLPDVPQPEPDPHSTGQRAGARVVLQAISRIQKDVSPLGRARGFVLKAKWSSQRHTVTLQAWFFTGSATCGVCRLPQGFSSRGVCVVVG